VPNGAMHAVPPGRRSNPAAAKTTSSRQAHATKSSTSAYTSPAAVVWTPSPQAQPHCLARTRRDGSALMGEASAWFVRGLQSARIMLVVDATLLDVEDAGG
jgi:hypothetical protein